MTQNITLANFHEIPFGATYPPNLQNTVTLTFDDGPDAAGKTQEILDILAAKRVSATFFVLLQPATSGLQQTAPSVRRTLRQMFAQGHEVGNHTMTHPQLKDLHATAIAAQLDGAELAAQQIMDDHTLRLLLCRAPYGRPMYPHDRQEIPELFAKVAQIMATRAVHIGWDYDTNDWQNKTTQQLIDETVAALDRGVRGIILMHSVHQRTVEALPTIIDAVRARGIAFVSCHDRLLATCGKSAAELLALPL